MDIPLRAYFFSPLNRNISQKLQDHENILALLRVDVQPARLLDILNAFQVALYDPNPFSLIQLAESLRNNPAEYPLDYNVNVDNNSVSAVHTISFTKPRLIPDRHADFCVYFTLETEGLQTLFTDLALFIRAVGLKLNRWSVLNDRNQLHSGNPAHPALQDLAYCWDGVTCAYGVLQFSANPISLLNIRRMFHRTSLICNPLCSFHRYEYFASGIFLDVDQVTILLAFYEMEIAAEELCDDQPLRIDIDNYFKRLPF